MALASVAGASGARAEDEPAAAASPRWRGLLHFAGAHATSTIDAPSFFVAPHGKTDPLAELQATRAALATGAPRIGAAGLDPLCAFPARARFVHDTFGDHLRNVPCEGLDDWRRRLTAKRVSLVFATAYVGNPASMFGHTFLKLDLGRAGDGRGLFDYAISFAADTGDAGPIAYVVKGLTGGFPGRFALAPYYERIQSYAFAESRDLWEYPLPLAESERLWLVEHLWEMYANAYADYYFLDENCSYAVLELLDAVVPGHDFAARAGFFVLPQEAIKAVLDGYGAQAPQALFWPSSQRVYAAAAARLSDAERVELAALLDGSLPPAKARSAAALDAALAWTNYRKSQLTMAAQESLRATERELLRARAKAGETPPLVTPVPTNRPDLAQAPRKIALGVGRADRDVAWRARWRYALHEFTDDDVGYESYYQLRYVDAQLDGVAKRLRTADATLIDVSSFVPVNTPGGKWAWAAGTHGGTRAPFVHRAAVFGHADFGVALALAAPRCFVYALGGGEAAVGGGPSELDATSHVGLVARFHARARLVAEALARHRLAPTGLTRDEDQPSPLLAPREASATFVLDLPEIAPPRGSVPSLEVAARTEKRFSAAKTLTVGFAYKY